MSSGKPKRRVFSCQVKTWSVPKNGARQVILFGSCAKGAYRPGSDIDLCLDAPGLTLTQQLEIETRLDDLLLPWKIDLVLMHEIDNPALLDHIRRVGVPLNA